MNSAPLSDAIIVAVAKLVDEAQSETREPSHADIEFQIIQAGLAQGQTVGKAKRVRATLSWALEHDPSPGEALVAKLISLVRARGGFRAGSPNYIGEEPIENATAVFRTEGYELSSDGELRLLMLERLAGADLTRALESYVLRARRGAGDAALVTGTGRDLLEAVAAHVLQSKYGTYPVQSNFPTLLGQVFVALGMATPEEPIKAEEPAHRPVERAMFELGCAINRLRNKDGTGHGRPWLPSVSDIQAELQSSSWGVLRTICFRSGKRMTSRTAAYMPLMRGSNVALDKE
jgi:hypothetical protein